MRNWIGSLLQVDFRDPYSTKYTTSKDVKKLFRHSSQIAFTCTMMFFSHKGLLLIHCFCSARVYLP